MAKTRVLLTGADGLTGSHLLFQLLSQETVSVRAVVGSRETAYTLQQQYQHAPLDLAIVREQESTVPGVFEDALNDYTEPFHAVIHALASSPSAEADCLARFVNIETERVIGFLDSVRTVARAVRRVVIVTSLTPFARWLVDPQVDQYYPGAAHIPGNAVAPDSEYILAASQASDNIVYDAVSRWVRENRPSFDIVHITAPSIYGPAVRPLETSSDLLEANRRIWHICSNESRESTRSPPYGIEQFLDVRVGHASPENSKLN